jgi:hypothetical protein
VKRTPLKRKTRLKPMSDKRAAQEVEWQKLKKEFLKDNPRCHVCTFRARDVHHMMGRGRFLLARHFLMSVCRNCHDFIEQNKTWARERGYILYQ